MTPTDLLDTLEERGITLIPDGTDLRYRGPRGAFTPDLRAAVASHKALLMEWGVTVQAWDRIGTEIDRLTDAAVIARDAGAEDVAGRLFAESRRVLIEQYLPTREQLAALYAAPGTQTGEAD